MSQIKSGRPGRPKLLPPKTKPKQIQIVPEDLARLEALVRHRRGPHALRLQGPVTEAETLRDAVRVGLVAGPRLAQAVLALRREADLALEVEDVAKAAELEAVAAPLEELFLWIYRGRPSDTPPGEGEVAERVRQARKDREAAEAPVLRAWLNAALVLVAAHAEAVPLAVP